MWFVFVGVIGWQRPEKHGFDCRMNWSSSLYDPLQPRRPRHFADEFTEIQPKP
jgi:hypothetical protein